MLARTWQGRWRVACDIRGRRSGPAIIVDIYLRHTGVDVHVNLIMKRLVKA